MERGLTRRLVSLHIPQVMALLMLVPLAVGQPATVAASSTTTCTASTFGAGDGYSGAITSNGQVVTWGRNYEGQLGIGVTGGVLGSPTPVVTSTGLTTATGFWAGTFTTFAVDPSGQLWGWGDNSFDERGSLSGFASPGPVVGPTQVVSVGPGAEHTIAATADGTLWGWGLAAAFGVHVNGSLFTGPVVVPGLSNVSKVAAGEDYSLVVTANGAVYGAGHNETGQAGLGSGLSQSDTFQPVPGLNGVVDVAASDAAGGSFSVVLDGSGHVLAFGSDFYGEMGNGSISQTTPQFTPTRVQGLDSVVSIAAGNGHVLALKSDHTVWAWGQNDSGQLGNGGTANSPVPVQVSFPAGVQLVSIAAGLAHSMALDSNGNLWSWGNNGEGEIGNGIIFGLPVTRPVMVNLGTVAAPCSPQVKTYLPSVNGYAFTNPGSPKAPSYERMAAFYPSSSWEMYYPIVGGRTWWGKKIYKEAFLPIYLGAQGFAGGLCYGMAASDQFLFNEFPSKSAVALYPLPQGLDSPFPGDLGASPSPSDPTIEDFIDRYHSRQFAASGVIASIDSWKNIEANGGNRAAVNVVADAVATGKTEWIGLGPSQAALTQEGQSRFEYLFNESHAVLAYFVDKTAMRIKVYDPNDPGDDHAYIQIVDSAMNPGGGIELVHHGDRQNPDISYGSGNATGQDLGQPGEWTLVPLPEQAFTDQGIVSGQDNRHWVLDAVPEIAIAAAGGIPLPYAGTLIYRILDVRTPDQTSLEYLPSDTALAGTVTSVGPGSSTTLAANMHTTEATQTDLAAAGTMHRVSISPNADHLALSGASATEQYTLQMSSDFITSGYGRQITVTGAQLLPGGILDMSVDSTFSSLSLAPSAMPAEQAGLLLEQGGQGAGSARVTLTIPGNGGAGNVFVGDWTALSTSLVFEAVTASDGSVTGILLQDNPAQRQALSAALLQDVQKGIARVADDGVRGSLQNKLDNASRQVAQNPRAAANMLYAMRNEIAAQNGKAVDPGLAAALDSTLREEIALLRAPLA